MRTLFSIAIKDIRLLLRDKMAAFFVLGLPLLMGLFFGLMMNSSSSGRSAKMKVALVDEDQSKYSQLLVQALESNKNVTVEPTSSDDARQSVQSGKRAAMLVIPKGYGDKAGLFWEAQPAIQLGVDPSRSAEGAMLEGFVMEAVGSLVGKRISNPKEMLDISKQAIDQIRSNEALSADRRTKLLDFFGEFDGFINSLDQIQSEPDESQASEPTPTGGFQIANIEKIDVTRQIDPSSIEGQVKKLRSRWDISFPQAMLWGILGCVAGFAISMAQEREAGTLLRLRVAPISHAKLLGGKALACFLSTLGVIVAMTLVGYFLGMRPLSYPKLAVAAISVALCFVGIMMMLSTLGKSVQSVSGIGWAANLIMAMIGGCMIPIMFMPEFISKLSVISPVRWAIQSIEGAIWRDFSWIQLTGCCSVLLAIGALGLLVGVFNSRRHEN